MTTRYARTPARKSAPSLGGLIVLVIVLAFISIGVDTALFEWVWNDFVVPHARGVAKASFGSCLTVGVVISIFIGAAGGHRTSSS